MRWSRQIWRYNNSPPCVTANMAATHSVNMGQNETPFPPLKFCEYYTPHINVIFGRVSSVEVWILWLGYLFIIASDVWYIGLLHLKSIHPLWKIHHKSSTGGVWFSNGLIHWPTPLKFTPPLYNILVCSNTGGVHIEGLHNAGRTYTRSILPRSLVSFLYSAVWRKTTKYASSV